MSTSFDDLAELGVDTLDPVGRVDHAPKRTVASSRIFTRSASKKTTG
jgi:hypothetical protein